MAEENPVIRAVYILNDPTAGTIAATVAAANPSLGVVCLYDKGESFLFEVARAALAEQIQSGAITVGQHNPDPHAPKRTRQAQSSVAIPTRDDSVLLLLPGWLDPDYDVGSGPRFEGVVKVPTRPARETRGWKRRTVFFEAPLMEHGLGICGTAGLFEHGLAHSTYLKKATALAFTTPTAGDVPGAAVIDLDEPEQEDTGLPAVTLHELRRLRLDDEWPSLFARGLLAGSIVVRPGA